MKWSQGLCAAILIDGLFPVSPIAKANPRRDGAFPGAPLEPASAPNALAADWGLSPERRTPALNLALYRVMKRRPPGFTSDS
jgi:hypothetical protein